MMTVLQLPSLEISTTTLQTFIQSCKRNHQSLYETVKEALKTEANLPQNEWRNLSKLMSTIQSLHNQLLNYPGSYLLYQFYNRIHELPQIMNDSERQSSLIGLLNELMYLEDGHSPLLKSNSSTPFFKLHDYIEYKRRIPFTLVSFHSFLSFLPLPSWIDCEAFKAIL